MRLSGVLMAVMLASLLLAQGVSGAGVGAGTDDRTLFPQPVPFPVWNVSASEDGDDAPAMYSTDRVMGVVWMRELEEPSTYQVMERTFDQVMWSTGYSWADMPGWDEELWASSPDPSRPPTMGTMSLNLNPVAVAYGDKVYVVWATDDPAYKSGADHDIVMRAYDPVRRTWGPVLSVTPGSAAQERLPAVAVHGSLLHIAWVTAVPAANGTTEDDVVMRTYDGAAFSDVVTVSEEEGVPERDWGVDMASVGDRLALVWERNNRTSRTDDYDVMYREWDGNAFMTPPVLVSAAPERVDRNPRVEDAGGLPFVVWESRPGTGALGGTTILGRSVRPGGLSPIVELTRHGSPADNARPDVVSAGGTAYVLWSTYDDAISHGPDADIVMRSYDGSDLGEVVELSDPQDGNASDGRVAACVSKGSVYATWVVNRTGQDGDMDFEVVVRRASGFAGEVTVLPSGRSVAGDNLTILLTFRDLAGAVAQVELYEGVEVTFGAEQVLSTYALHFEANGSAQVHLTPSKAGRYVVSTTYGLGSDMYVVGSLELYVYEAPGDDDGGGSTVYIAVMLVAVLAGAVAVVLALRRQ